MAAPMKVLLTFGVVSILVVGLYDVLIRHEENGCEMTYMYEWPQYLNVPLGKEVAEKFPGYELFIYGEGKYADSVKSLSLTGIPVLFIPGNAGSHKQVRSLGSVALRKAESRKFHFNYFVVGLKEELSGLFGGVLHDQTAFVHECVKHILTLYKQAKHPPSSVVLVGHSMGGMVARALFTLPDFNPSLVHTIITQATPHQGPVVPIDGELAEFYEHTNRYWQRNSNGSLRHVTVFSSGGGYRDFQVRTSLTSLRRIVAGDRHISSLTMSVPKAWVSTDHLCHVWCKQIVLATKRAMFDMVDTTTKQISTDPDLRVAVFKHHFTSHPGTKTVQRTWKESFILTPSVKWELKEQAAWKFSRDKVKSERHLAMPIKPEMDGLIVISNTANSEWIGACELKKGEEKCTQMINLSRGSRSIPPLYSGKRFQLFNTTSFAIMGVTHIVIIIPKSSSMVEVMAEQYDTRDRHVLYLRPSFWDQVQAYWERQSTSHVAINQTAEKALLYRLGLPEINGVMKAYKAHLTPVQCKEHSEGNYAGSLVSFRVPWNEEDTHSFSKPSQPGLLALKLQTSQPANFFGSGEMMLVLHPSCTYSLSISLPFTDVFGQFMRFYGTLLPTYFAIQIFMVIVHQLRTQSLSGDCPSFTVAHAAFAQPYKITLFSAFVRFVVNYPPIASALYGLGLPATDDILLEQKGVWFNALPILLCIAVYALVFYMGHLLEFKLAVLARIWGLICSCCCASPSLRKITSVLHYLIVMAAVALAGSVCGSLGITIVYIIYIIRVIQLKVAVRQSSDATKQAAQNKYNFHSSLFSLWMILFILHAPQLIVWAKNLPFAATLERDPSRVTAVLSTLSYLAMLYGGEPIPYRFPMLSLLPTGMYLAGVGMVLYATESVYRISYFIAVSLAFMCLPQALAAPPTPQIEEEEEKEKED